MHARPHPAPTYNENDNIELILREIFHAVPQVEVL